MDIASIIEMSAQWGIFAALFVALFVYVVKENKTRENGYKKIIEVLGEKLHVLSCDSNKVAHNIYHDVEEVDEKVTMVSNKLEIVSKNVDTVDEKTDKISKKLDEIHYGIGNRLNN